MVKKSDWKTVDMPLQAVNFTLERTLTPEEIEIISIGHRPKEMEDKWFMYVQDNHLFIHRSWTGFCIYKVDLDTKGALNVTVNRDMSQYKETDIEQDKTQLNILINSLLDRNGENVILMKKYIAGLKSESAESKIYQMLADLHTGKIERYFYKPEEESMEVKKLCDLRLLSGKVVANDPICLYEFEPFSFKVDPGRYPVYLYVHHIKTDSRVAFAEIRFSDEEPVRYQPAVFENFEKFKFTNLRYQNYGVDSGTGCFMDSRLAQKIKNFFQEENENLLNDIDEKLGKTYINTYGAVEHIPQGEKDNMAIFSTGWGDGAYNSFCGYSDEGELCTLTTYFETLNIDIDWGRGINNLSNVLDKGISHSNKIKKLGLDTDVMAGYSHLAVFLRWMAEHGFLSDDLLKLYPELPTVISDKNTDLRYIIQNIPVFAHKLALAHFKGKGAEFAKAFYVFNSNGYPCCVDAYAEKILGTEKYNCKEYQNEAYLFVKYDEEYYKGLSWYIDKAWEDFCKENQ